MSDQTNTTEQNTSFSKYLRKVRRSLVPHVVEYHTTDNRIVDAIRLLDNAADHIEAQQGRIDQLERDLAAARAELDKAREDGTSPPPRSVLPSSSAR